MRASQDMAQELKRANHEFSHHEKTYGASPAKSQTRRPLGSINH